MGTDAQPKDRHALAELRIPIAYDVPLGPLTWYGIGGHAEVLAQPEDATQLGRLLAHCHQHAIPVQPLGKGANLLVLSGGVKGVVVLLDAPAFRHIQIQGDRVIAGAGTDLARLIMTTARAGLAGLEILAGIPATVGGALRMNAGGRYGAIGPAVHAVTTMNARGESRRLEQRDLSFTYRHSSIVEPFILAAEFALRRADPGAVRQRVKEIFDYKKSTQPLGAKSAGCAFKNPIDQSEKSAGQLIEEAGLKGFQIGAACVSAHHANFITLAADYRDRGIVPDPDEIFAVLRHVEQTVLQKHGITLERELVIWGEAGHG